MAIKKPAIPTISGLNTINVLGALKENIEVLTGARHGELTQLASTATTSEIIDKINQIVIRMNASGK